MSMPTFEDSDWTDGRKKIIEGTYEQALKEGDKNIFFLSGNILFGKNARDCCTVDGVHPNDLGFYRIARAMEPFFTKIRF